MKIDSSREKAEDGSAPPAQIDKADPEFSWRAFDDSEDLPPIASRQGMSINDLVRAKIHYLAAQDRSLIQQIQLSDAKAATAMTLVGLIAVNSADLATLKTGPFVLLDGVFWLLVFVCMLSALWSVTPRYPPASARDEIVRRDRYSWPGLASDVFSGEDYADFMDRGQASHLVRSRARNNSALSGILLRKFRALRLAFQAGGGALAALLARVAFT